MELLKRINQAMQEFPEQASIVSDTYSGYKLFWMIDMAWCLVRYGARPIDYVRFEFHKKSGRERDRYLTIFKYFKLAKKLKKTLGGNLMGYKTNEYKLFSEYIKREWMIVDAQTSESDVRTFIQKHQTVIAKPNNGEQGKGVMKIKVEDQKKINELLDLKSHNVFVLEECLKNIEDLDRMNPSSLNTIRCYTMIDKEGKDRIMEIILRAGAPGSHVDNWGSGGVAYYFDVETGICKGPGVDKKNKTHMLHPGSQFQVVGYKLPDYEKLLDYIHQLMNVDRTARFVGWDIALTPNGYDLVEMNCPGGHDLLQGFGKPWGSFFKENW